MKLYEVEITIQDYVANKYRTYVKNPVIFKSRFFSEEGFELIYPNAIRKYLEFLEDQPLRINVYELDKTILKQELKDLIREVF